MEFLIMGSPIPQCRHRVYGKRTYDPISGKKYQVRCLLYSEMVLQRYTKLVKELIEVKMTIHTPIAKSLSKRKQNALDGKLHGMVPDVDNLAKFYMDAMTGIVYDDDKWICKLSVEKRKSFRPRVEIYVGVVRE